MTDEEYNAVIMMAFKMTLKEGDDVLYLTVKHKIKKVWNRGGEKVFYDLEGENPVYQGSKIVQENVHWTKIDLVTTTPTPSV